MANDAADDTTDDIDEVTAIQEAPLDDAAFGEITAVTSLAAQSLQNLVGTVPLFSGFPEKLVSELQKAATIAHIAPEETILRQGEYNKNLYFLILGTVDVFVDGGLVATLRRKGDLLGEMSVITEKPCSASIVAKTPCELICVNIDEFRRVTGENKDQFDHILYRIYSKILTDKVNLTNQRAKKVEDTLDQLQRAKNELQEINAQMERRVVERTQALQSKLQELLNSHLIGLENSLKEASQKLDAAAKPVIVKSAEAVQGVIQFLEPLVQRFNLEVSMKSKRVLLAQGEKKAQTVAKMALGGTGIHIQAVPTLEEAKDKIAAEAFDVALVDGETLDLVDSIAGLEKKPRVIFVASQTIKDHLPKLLSLKTLPNIVFVREEDRAGSIRTIMTTVTKLCSPSIFGLEKYLNVGVEVREHKIQKSTERQMLNDEMREHFSKLGVRGSMLDSVGLVLEELLMNAIYDAPMDAAGNSLYNKLPRTTAVDLNPNEQGLFRYALDGTLLAISVEDPFGGLTAKTIINYLDSCYSGKEGTMQDDKGGAGRGLHQIVENSMFVVFNVQPRRRTEIIAFFDIVPGKKESAGPMLHWCTA